jgi:hypothetical protein
VFEQATARHPAVAGIRALRDVAHLRTRLGATANGVQSVDLRGAGVGTLQIHQHLERGALARAVRSDQDVHGSLGNAKVDVVECGLSTVSF